VPRIRCKVFPALKGVGVRSLLFSTKDIIHGYKVLFKDARKFCPNAFFCLCQEQGLEFGNNNKKSSNFVLTNRVIHKVRRLGGENGQFQGIGSKSRGDRG
jgi:hypothetical protein